MNKVELEGNIGKDPVPFNTKGEVSGLFVSLAVNNSSKADAPTWVRCFAYADVAQGMKAIALKKGDRLRLEGELRQDGEENLFLRISGGRRIKK